MGHSAQSWSHSRATVPPNRLRGAGWLCRHNVYSRIHSDSTFIGEGKVLFFICLNFALQAISDTQSKVLRATDARIGKATELVQHMNVLKMLGWEKVEWIFFYQPSKSPSCNRKICLHNEALEN